MFLSPIVVVLLTIFALGFIVYLNYTEQTMSPEEKQKTQEKYESKQREFDRQLMESIQYFIDSKNDICFAQYRGIKTFAISYVPCEKLSYQNLPEFKPKNN
jgi:hypothetical protein